MRIGISSRGGTYASMGIFSGTVFLLFKTTWDLIVLMLRWTAVACWYLAKWSAIGAAWVYASIALLAVKAARRARLIEYSRPGTTKAPPGNPDGADDNI